MTDWKKIVFAIAICLLYISIVFMAVNTFFPEMSSMNECYRDFKVISPDGMEPNQTQMDESNNEMRDCEIAYEKERAQYDSWKFIVIMILNILAAFVMLLNIDKSIIFGLFFGVTITAFSATIRYINSRSVIGFGLLVLLFGIIIYFVNSKKDNWGKEWK